MYKIASTMNKGVEILKFLYWFGFGDGVESKFTYFIAMFNLQLSLLYTIYNGAETV